MGILTKILTFPLTGPVDGLVFIAKNIQKQLEEQQRTTESPQARLLELESLLLLGEITDEEYQSQEQLILQEIEEALAQKEHMRAQEKQPG